MASQLGSLLESLSGSLLNRLTSQVGGTRIPEIEKLGNARAVVGSTIRLAMASFRTFGKRLWLTVSSPKDATRQGR